MTAAMRLSPHGSCICCPHPCIPQGRGGVCKGNLSLVSLALSITRPRATRKAPKRRLRRMKRGGFEEVSRLPHRASGRQPADTTVSAAEHAKETPPGWVVFLFVIVHRFCCLHSRPPQGRGSVRGEPLTGSPTRVQSPARRRSLLRSKSAAPKKKDTHVGVFLFWSGRRGSNSLPRPWQGRALPDELRPQTQG